MSRKMSPWLDDKPAPDVRALTTLELLALWSESRNSTQGVMAAEEVMRRLVAENKLKETTT